MFKLMDRYILRQYLSKFTFAIVTFVIIFIIVDIVDHLDKFIDSDIPRFEIIQYYYYTLPWFVSIGIPMALLLSTVFSMGLMQRNHEITAIKASGISVRRIGISLLMVGVIFSIFSFYLENELVAPYLYKRSQLEGKYFNTSHSNWKTKKQNINRQINQNTILNIQRYSFKNDAAYHVSIQNFKNGDIRYRLDAPLMIWDQVSEKWNLPQHRIRQWDDNSGKYEFNYSNSDTLLQLDFTPVDLTTESVKPSEMNYQELAVFVEKLKYNGIHDPRWEVNLHFKTAFACSSFLMILFGISLSIRRPRSSMTVGLGMSIVVIFLYYAILKFGQSLGYKSDISPFLSVWMGNIIFMAIGLVMLFRART